MDYAAELKSLWADADHYKPIQLPHSRVCSLGEEVDGRKKSDSIFKGLKPRI